MMTKIIFLPMLMSAYELLLRRDPNIQQNIELTPDTQGKFQQTKFWNIFFLSFSEL